MNKHFFKCILSANIVLKKSQRDFKKKYILNKREFSHISKEPNLKVNNKKNSHKIVYYTKCKIS